MRKEPCSPMVGADVEHFVEVMEPVALLPLSDKPKGTIVPCVGIIPGTKAEPHTPKGYNKGYAMQEDNVMAEYNIPPLQDAYDISEALSISRNMIDRELPEHMRLNKEKTTHKFRPIELMSPQAKLIGCEPDQDAYKQGAMRTFGGRLGLERSCGGHIHLGGDFNCPDWVAALFADYFIGVFGLTINFQKDSRSSWYGMPGIFRSKPYGIEYRTPNSSWTWKYADSTAGCALGLARWLTQTDAEVIRSTLRGINWPRVQKYLTAGSEHQTPENWREMEIEFNRVGLADWMFPRNPWDFEELAPVPAPNAGNNWKAYYEREGDLL